MAALPENDRFVGPYLATAGQTDFPADFPLIRIEGLRVRVRRVGQPDQLIQPPAVAAVDVVGETFTARLTVPMAGGEQVFVYSDLPAARPRAHTPGGAVRTETLEGDAREFQAQLQEQKRELDTTLRVLPGETPPTGDEIRAAAELAAGKANTVLDNATVKPDETGAVSRAVYVKAREHLSVDDFNDVLIDDVTALERVFDAALNENNKLPVRQFKSLTVDAPLAIPSGLILTGPYPSADHPIDAQGFDASEGVLRIAAGVSITAGNAARIEKMRAIRLGLVEPTDAASSLAAVAAMAGTAFTAPNNIGFEMADMQIVGFERAIDMANNGRCRLSRIKIDCENGVRLQDSLDVSIIEQVHAWPWLTAGVSGAEFRGLRRAGIGIDVGGGAIQNDFTQVLACFTFGYGIGFQSSGAAHLTFQDCAADNVVQLHVSPDPTTAAEAAATIGINVQGTSRNTLISNFKGAAQGRTVVVQPTGRTPRVTIRDLRSWAPVQYDVHHVAGEMVLDTAGLETKEPDPWPIDGHKIKIEDTITSAHITQRGPNPSPLVVSPATLAEKVILETDTQSFRQTAKGLIGTEPMLEFSGGTDGGLVTFPLIRAGLAEAYRSKKVEYFEVKADSRAMIPPIPDTGGSVGDGNRFGRFMGLYVERESAPLLQSEQHAPLIIAVRSDRQYRFDGEGNYIFADVQPLQLQASIVPGNFHGTMFGGHSTGVIPAGADGQMRVYEFELHNFSGTAWRSPAEERVKQIAQLVSVGGEAKYAIHVVARDGGSIYEMLKTELTYIQPATAPVAFADAPTYKDYGGSLVRFGDVFRLAHHAGEVIQGVGHMDIRRDANIVRHIKKVAVDCYDLFEMAAAGGNGWASINFVVTGIFGKSIGLDRASREIRISNVEGLSDADTLLGVHDRYVNIIGSEATNLLSLRRSLDGKQSFMRLRSFANDGRAFISLVDAGATQFAYSLGIDNTEGGFLITAVEGLGATPRLAIKSNAIGLHGQPDVSGGGNLLWSALGTAPTGIGSGGYLRFHSDGTLKFRVAGFPERTVVSS